MYKRLTRYNELSIILTILKPIMRFTYDLCYNIAYIRFHEKSTEVETIRISDELNIDMAPDGTIYGIELFNANEQLQGDDMGNF